MIIEMLAVSLVLFKGYQHKERNMKDKEDQIQLAFTILIGKLHSNFFYTPQCMMLTEDHIYLTNLLTLAAGLCKLE